VRTAKGAVGVVAAVVVLAYGPLAAQERPACVVAGLEQVNDGAFETGARALDACIASLETGATASAGAPNLADAYLYKGVALVGLRQEDAAKGAFRKVLEYAPTFEPDRDAFSPRVIRIFKAARVGKKKSVIDPPSGTARKAGIGASGIAAIAGAAALVGGGAAAVIAAQPTATTTPTAIPTPAPTPSATATATEPPSPPPFRCPFASEIPAPVWVTPAEGAVISGTVIVQCVPALYAECVAGMVYSLPTGQFVARPYTATVLFDTSTLPSGPAGLFCSTLPSIGVRGASRQVIIDHPTATATATVTATATPTATETPTPTATETPVATETATPGGDPSTPSANGPSKDSPSVILTWTSALSSTGGKGQVWLNGAGAIIQASGQQTVSLSSDQGTHTIQGELIEGTGAGGLWTFQLRRGFKAGSIQTQSGNVAQLTPDTVVFRLAGRKGERVAFTFEAAGS
jgi:hypothetical protein